MPYGATQDGRVMVERYDRMWSTGEENGKPLQYSCLENPMNSMKRGGKKGHWKRNSPGQQVPNMILEISGEITSERMKRCKNNTKQKQHQVVGVTGDRSRVWCCKEQYCIGTWNVRSLNRGKLEVVKQEMARVNVDILGISQLRWTGMGEFNSDDHYIYYCGQESLRRNGVTISQQKSLKYSIWMQSQKWQNDLCLFPRQTIKFHSNPSPCLTSNAEEAEVEWC